MSPRLARVPGDAPVCHASLELSRGSEMRRARLANLFVEAAWVARVPDVQDGLLHTRVAGLQQGDSVAPREIVSVGNDSPGSAAKSVGRVH